jgi:hypothetical protein
MRVDRSYKGSLPTEVQLLDDGMCDGPDLKVGKQYLMYTAGDPAKRLPARGCTRSRSVEYAAEDLQFLNAFVAGKTNTEIRGKVRYFEETPDNRASSRDSGRPLTDVSVTLTQTGAPTGSITFQTRSDSSGNFSLSGLPPGNYDIRTTLLGHVLERAPSEILLADKACAVADVWLKADRRVEGWVRTRAGDPVAGAHVQMLPSKPDSDQGKDPILEARSGENGFYSIQGVPPGEFYLGISLTTTPTKESPYAAAYYPDSKDAQGASPIVLPEGPTVRTYDLIAPAKLKLVRVRGKVSNAMGQRPEQRPTIRFKEPGPQDNLERLSPELDADGGFAMELCEGIRYIAYANIIASPKVVVYSEPIEFTAGEAELNFVLDKTPTQFGPLIRKLFRR